MRVFLITVAAFVVLGTLFIIRVSVWRECRDDHSFFYCAELMGGR